MSTTRKGRNSGVAVTIKKGADDNTQPQQSFKTRSKKNFSEALVSLNIQCFLGVPFASIYKTIIIIIIISRKIRVKLRDFFELFQHCGM
jgi:hypothetical protein